MFHGCGGAYDKTGALARRMREYAELFNGLGMHVLVVDSLTARYEKELCTQRNGTRRVTQANRRLDALGAIAYLGDRADVDAKRIGMIGWSNGGSTVLSATNLHHRDVAAATVKPAFAIAFYPGCESELKRGYSPSVPLLMLVGQIDDWTPSAPCVALAKSASEMRPEIVVYAGAWHGFDSDAPVRLRKDVPNGVNPGKGVHVGGNPAAWRASRDRVVRFLAEH
jgi:dienelactone hydrolase